MACGMTVLVAAAGPKTYRCCSHDNVMHCSTLIEGSRECEASVNDVGGCGVASLEGRGIGVCQVEAGVGHKLGGVHVAGQCIWLVHQLLCGAIVGVEGLVLHHALHRANQKYQLVVINRLTEAVVAYRK